MSKHTLTEKHIPSAQPGRYHLGDGLSLYVSGDGQVRRWIHRYSRPNGLGVTEAGLGPWPVVTLEEAKAKVLEHRRLLRAGIDPIQARNAERKAGTTFKELADKFVSDNRAHWAPSTVRNIERALYTYSKRLHTTPVSDLTTDKIRDALAALKSRHLDAALRTRGVIERVLEDHAPNGANPARFRYKVPRGARGNSHFRAMSYTNIPAFFKQLGESATSMALKFTILTACRTGEVLGATRDEFQVIPAYAGTSIWTIPGPRTKTRKPFRTPLSTLAIDILNHQLQQSRGAYIFSGFNHGQKPLDARAMKAFLHGRDNTVSVHGFRSAFRDWATEQTDFDFYVVEMCLAHQVGNAVTRAYLRGEALDKRRAVMQAWASYCETGC
jgi:integrase